MDLTELQRLMEALYGQSDRARGVPSTVAWLAEELGELAQAVRKGTREQQVHEFGDGSGVARISGESDGHHTRRGDAALPLDNPP